MSLSEALPVQKGIRGLRRSPIDKSIGNSALKNENSLRLRYASPGKEVNAVALRF